MGTGHVGKGYWGHIYGAVQCNAKHKTLCNIRFSTWQKWEYLTSSITATELWASNSPSTESEPCSSSAPVDKTKENKTAEGINYVK